MKNILRLETPLERDFQDLLERRRASSTLRNLTLNTNKIDFSSNDFLSLSKNPSLQTAFLDELQRENQQIGSGGSRLLDGNSKYAEDLEEEIASFHGAESGLLFNSGFDANAGFFACVPQKGDVVVYDELIHASVHDGMRMSRAEKTLPFKHNCVQHLEAVLRELWRHQRNAKTLKGRPTHIFVAVESIYSMDGDLAPLRSIVKTVEEILPKGTGYIVVDEAHATGVIGPQGRGLVSHLGLERRIFARLHTFGKAMACNGAIILGSPVLRHYLINYARPLIYTTSMSFPMLSAVRASYSLLKSGRTDPLASKLQCLIEELFNRLQALRTPAFQALLTLPTKRPKSPIFSVQLSEPKILAIFLQERGMMVRAVVPPTVPEGTSRVRICLHAGNTVGQIEDLVAAIGKWCIERPRAAETDTIQTVKTKFIRAHL